jgi:tRNA-specific 2-thiouridylase
MSSKHKKVIIGLSGGVDSAVSAYLLKQQGYQVEALFMKNWEEDDTDNFCSATQDIIDAQDVCDKLKIPLHTVNFSDEYWNDVFEHCLSEYRAGRTPNPDILCNREIKFKAFLNYALNLGADYIATGHYAHKGESDHSYQLNKAFDNNKDQSYFLYTLDQFALSKTLFPLNSIDKPTVRKLAAEANFKNHQKKDSTGICFIGERKFRTFLKQYIPAQPGNIETSHKQMIGRHEGLMFYTLGQRQGLNIGGLTIGDGSPWYVVDKDLERNVLIVAQGEDQALLYSHTLEVKDLHWIGGKAPNTSFSCQSKIRYRQSDQICQVTLHSDHHGSVIFANAQRAITPGQSIVFYADNECLGGGIIQ